MDGCGSDQSSYNGKGNEKKAGVIEGGQSGQSCVAEEGATNEAKLKGSKHKKREKSNSHYVYRDFSDVRPTPLDLMQVSSAQESTDVLSQKLPFKLNMILSNQDSMFIIRWAPHGRAWRITDRDKFVSEILPTYFGHSNFESFVRLVNAWGFRRYPTGADRGSYYHELFLRGMPHLHARMKRLTKDQIKTPIEYEDRSPNFYSMPVPGTSNLDQTQAIPDRSSAIDAGVLSFFATSKSNTEEKKAISTQQQEIISARDFQGQTNKPNTLTSRQHDAVPLKTQTSANIDVTNTNQTAQKGAQQHPTSNVFQGVFPFTNQSNTESKVASAVDVQSSTSAQTGTQAALLPSVAVPANYLQAAQIQQPTVLQTISQPIQPLTFQFITNHNFPPWNSQVPLISFQPNDQLSNSIQLLPTQINNQTQPTILWNGNQLANFPSASLPSLPYPNIPDTSANNQQTTQIYLTSSQYALSLLHILRSIVQANIQTPEPQQTCFQIIDLLINHVQNQSHNGTQGQPGMQASNPLYIPSTIVNSVSQGNNSLTASTSRADESEKNNNSSSS